ncbi:shwachman-Bodian-Diamond syndrome protein [Diaporthe helianthi]|uniref:Ribosome maturation protein SDO1 n=1 Tax=Diaporthe helianthi TaxID=158607 RepID=A0A2P5HMM7_DIAHE|nr:shwachman-Bodian-Diamond syndrome protein [Diaporthe helianthi]
MSRQINQPSNQIKLTNVSLVRLKKGKKRFEIACYKNKVLEWRSGIETDLDNVLQIPNVFLNVSKGQTAPSADLAKAFGKDMTTDAIVLEILNKGELQVGERERAAQLERVHNEVVGIVASKLVDPRTKRVYTTGMIEKALDMLSQQAHQNQGGHAGSGNDKDSKSASASASGSVTPAAAEDGSKPAVSAAAAAAAAAQVASSSSSSKEYIWTGVTTTKSAKSQALEAIKALIAKQPIPVARARMRLRITCSTGVLKQAVKAPAAEKGGKDKKGGKVAGRDDEEDGEKKAPGTVKDKILGYVEQIENQDIVGSEWELVAFVEPGAYKGLSDFVANETKGQGRVEVLDTAVTTEDE